ncbi:MAG: hypothetical protein ACFB0B_15915 [Thermonemataceae bacterium]
MKAFFLVLITTLFLFTGNPVTRIARMNESMLQAQRLYQQQAYKKAASTYLYLMNDLSLAHAHLPLNVGNCYFRLGAYKDARSYYKKVLVHPQASIQVQSLAQLQLGNIAYRYKELQEALQLYKEALLKDPYNRKARYNYELLKKKLAKEATQKGKQPKPQQDQKTPKKQTPKQRKESKTKPTQQKEESPQLGKPKRIKDLKMSEEKAKMLLEAMKENEAQYIQNLRRKKTSKQEDDRPDW